MERRNTKKKTLAKKETTILTNVRFFFFFFFLFIEGIIMYSVLIIVRDCYILGSIMEKVYFAQKFKKNYDDGVRVYFKREFVEKQP